MPTISGDLTLENAKLKASLTEAQAELRKFKAQARSEGAGLGQAFFGQMKGAGMDILAKLGLAGGAVGIAETIHHVMEEYGKLADMAARFDASPESIQRLDLHAKLTGTSVESLVTGIQRLKRALENPGDPQVVKALDQLKLSAVDLAGLQPDEQIERLAAAFNEAQHSGRGFDAVFDLMGKSAGELIPALREFAENKERIASISFVSDEDVRKIKSMGDWLTLLWEKTKGGAIKEVLHPSGSNAISATGFLLGRLLGGASTAPKSTDDSQLAEIQKLGEEKLKQDTEVNEVLKRTRRNELTKELADMNKVAAARKALTDTEAASAEVDMGSAEKIAREKQRILELDKQIAALQGPGADIEVERLKLMQERARVLGEIAGNEKQLQEQQKRDATAMEKRAREQDFRGVQLFGSRRDQMEWLRKELAESLDLDQITGADQVREQLDKLRSRAAAAHAEGNFELEKSIRDQIDRAEGDAGRLAGLGRGRSAAVAGETATALGILTGRGGTDLVLDESKRGNQLLEGIKNVLEDIRRDGSGDGDYATPGGFGFDFRH